MAVGWLVVGLMFFIDTTLSYDELHPGHFTNDFAVEFHEDTRDIQQLVQSHGFKIKRNVRSLGNVYVLEHDDVPHRSKRSASHLASPLQDHPNVKRLEQQQVLTRVKRDIVHDKQREMTFKEYTDKSVYQRYYETDTRLHAKNDIPQDLPDNLNFNDPQFPDQWYLHNQGQTGGKVGYDVNVVSVWEQGITGQGVVVSILDDGIDHTHPDLQGNYDPEASADMNDRTDRANDPMPNVNDSMNSHGTRCAGEVAAIANNNNCGVGIAYHAKIGGVRMLDGHITDMLEAEALTYNNQHVDIYSASWGPSDDGKTLEGPGSFARGALLRGVLEGRGGKGSLFIWATGNGGVVDDDCSCDGYVSSIETLSIGCVSDQGLSTYFSEICPSTMAVIFTGGAHEPPGSQSKEKPHVKVVTTDLNGKCTLDFQGTSSAAPLAAGCFALVLEANPELTWRDVQNIVVETARIPNAREKGWMVNGAGYHVNHRFGFGAIDCGKMVEVAQHWKLVGPQTKCEVEPHNPEATIRPGETVVQTLDTDACDGEAGQVLRLEHTQIHINITHRKRGDLNIVLISPTGTESVILSLRPRDESDAGMDFTFMTVHNWGEDPRGTWTLRISDMSDEDAGHSSGKILSWNLILWGTATKRGSERSEESSLRRETEAELEGEEVAHEAKHDEVKDIMKEEEVSSENLHIEPEQEQREKKGKANNKYIEDSKYYNQGSKDAAEDQPYNEQVIQNRFQKSWEDEQNQLTDGDVEVITRVLNHENYRSDEYEHVVKKIQAMINQRDEKKRVNIPEDRFRSYSDVSPKKYLNKKQNKNHGSSDAGSYTQLMEEVDEIIDYLKARNMQKA